MIMYFLLVTTAVFYLMTGFLTMRRCGGAINMIHYNYSWLGWMLLITIWLLWPVYWVIFIFNWIKHALGPTK